MYRSILILFFVYCNLIAQDYSHPEPGRLYSVRPVFTLNYGYNRYRLYNANEVIDNPEYEMNEFFFEIYPDPFLLSDGPYFKIGTIYEKLTNATPEMMSRYDPPQAEERINYFSLIMCNNHEKYGFDVGFDIITGYKSVISYLPIPHLNFKYGYLKKYYFSVSVTDLLERMPYSIGFHYKLSRLEIHLRGCLLKKYYAMNMKFDYNVKGDFVVRTQLISAPDQIFPLLRFGIVYK